MIKGLYGPGEFRYREHIFYAYLIEEQEKSMSKRIIAVNAGPRTGWNTDTLQLKDYGKTDWPWSIFDPEEKKARHETVFPEECRKAFEKGAALVR